MRRLTSPTRVSRATRRTSLDFLRGMTHIFIHNLLRIGNFSLVIRGRQLMFLDSEKVEDKLDEEIQYEDLPGLVFPSINQ